MKIGAGSAASGVRKHWPAGNRKLGHEHAAGAGISHIEHAIVRPAEGAVGEIGVLRRFDEMRGDASSVEAPDAQPV